MFLFSTFLQVERWELITAPSVHTDAHFEYLRNSTLSQPFSCSNGEYCSRLKLCRNSSTVEGGFLSEKKFAASPPAAGEVRSQKTQILKPTKSYVSAQSILLDSEVNWTINSLMAYIGLEINCFTLAHGHNLVGDTGDVSPHFFRWGGT